jgi:hypothetical protein
MVQVVAIEGEVLGAIVLNVHPLRRELAGRRVVA